MSELHNYFSDPFKPKIEGGTKNTHENFIQASNKKKRYIDWKCDKG